ncbi:hypothetical protein HZC32_02060 [Candidatus Woesearchaeota archaeon]|nr:hypothetical protein [Candidatus Woesearchaeota archaeon]
MHKQRIIDGIEKVFKGYTTDRELVEALNDYIPFYLFTWEKKNHFLGVDGNFFIQYGDDPITEASSVQAAAKDYFSLLRQQNILPLDQATVQVRLREDLGKRVEDLKRAYARHFDNECERQAENRYAQHPEA